MQLPGVETAEETVGASLSGRTVQISAVFSALTGRADAINVSVRSQCASKKTSPQSAYGCLFQIRAASPHTYSYPLSSNLSALAPINYLTNGAEFDILSERSKDSRYLYGVNPAEDGIIF